MQSQQYFQILKEAEQYKAKLIVVTKNQSFQDIEQLYQLGCRTMAENRVQALMERKTALPDDIQWHLIGSLQKNKVKYISPFIHCIHSLDSFELALEINKQANKHNRIIPVLFEIKIAQEESKQGFNYAELIQSLTNDPWQNLQHLKFEGVMGMASFTADDSQIRSEFKALKNYFESLKKEYAFLSSFCEISMGMSGDYKIALEEGSTMIRVGSKIFQ